MSQTLSAPEKIKIIQLRDSVTDVFWQPLSDAIRPDGGGSEISMGVDWNSGIGSIQGLLRLDVNGKGFASYRAVSDWNLESTQTIEFNVRGDGRRYKLLLKDEAAIQSSEDFSYQAGFETVADQWIAVKVSVSDFKAIYRGRPVERQPIALDRIKEIGLQINDGIPGAFKLEFSEIYGIRN